MHHLDELKNKYLKYKKPYLIKMILLLIKLYINFFKFFQFYL